jgi:SAM-dependent methyltransferase
MKKTGYACMSETTRPDAPKGTSDTLHDQEVPIRDSFAGRCISAARALVPSSVKRWIRKELHRYRMRPPLGWVRFGTLSRLTPISQIFGLDRGQPIDRYYIDTFLRKRSGDIHAHVLEIGEPYYTRQFGGNRVTRSAVLHAVSGNPAATLVGDLVTGQGIPRDAFDCMILTQTFHVIYDVRAAIATVFSALKPGGVLLATVPGISQISRYDMDRWGDYWRFTTRSARLLLEEVFPAENVLVEAYGNVYSAIAFLHGLAAEELSQEKLDHRDQDYEVVITLRAVKPAVAR